LKVKTVEVVEPETVLDLNPSIFVKRVEGCCDQAVAAVLRTLDKTGEEDRDTLLKEAQLGQG
jgi:hypothetical protein